MEWFFLQILKYAMRNPQFPVSRYYVKRAHQTNRGKTLLLEIFKFLC
jgi:hypothetical protein